MRHIDIQTSIACKILEINRAVGNHKVIMILILHRSRCMNLLLHGKIMDLFNCSDRKYLQPANEINILKNFEIYFLEGRKT